MRVCQCLIVIALLYPTYTGQASLPPTDDRQIVKLGVVLDTGTEQLQSALARAVRHQRTNDSLPFLLEPALSVINTANVYKISRLICDKVFSLGVHVLLASVNRDAFATLHSYANTFAIPFVAPWSPPKSRLVSAESDFTLRMRPEYHRAVLDLARHYRWTSIVFIYDSEDGLHRLQQIMQQLQPAAGQLRVQHVQLVNTAEQAIEFLHSLEAVDRWSNKQVVLDCEAPLAQSIITLHVQDGQLGRRNFHYLLSGLVIDELWSGPVHTQLAGAGAAGAPFNITGFSLVASDSRLLSSVISGGDGGGGWQHTTATATATASSTLHLTAQTALMYDSVMVIGAALSQLWPYLPVSVTSSAGRHQSAPLSHHSLPQPRFNCSHTPSHAHRGYDIGTRLLKQLTQVRLQGLTGNVEFNSAGVRTNYLLHVLEISQNRRLQKIGEWSEREGFRHTVANKAQWPTSRRDEQTDYLSRTLTVASISLAPFLSQFEGVVQAPHLAGNDRYYGFCKDLLDLLAKEVGFQYQLRVAADDRIGWQNFSAESGWDGLIGELLTNRAQLAVAPIPITLQREQVVYFTKPFLSTSLALLMKKPVHTSPGVLSFLSPFSGELWLCMASAFIGVVVVLFLVTKLSPTASSLPAPSAPQSAGTTCGSAAAAGAAAGGGGGVETPGVGASVWFVAGSLFGHCSHWPVRSCSSRIVAACWWLFCAIIVATYTANLAALLTVSRMARTISSVEQLVAQRSVDYGVVDGSVAMTFLQQSQVGIYRAMWEHIQAEPERLLPDHKTAVERVRNSKGKFALLMDSSVSDHVTGQRPCDTVSVTQPISSAQLAVAAPLDSPIKEALNLAVLKLLENGEVHRLQDKWWRRNDKCDQYEHNSLATSDGMMLSSLAGMFYLLIGGLIVALVTALVEICVKSRSHSKEFVKYYSGDSLRHTNTTNCHAHV